MVVPTDARGWIMTGISGLACVLGASVICADIVVCKFPGMKGFRIQDSDTFLSASLSLSFGVMLFSAMYKMLPSAKESLQEGNMSSKAAAWVLIVCFIVGAVGIQAISRILHHYIPSHVVNCEHSHDGHEEDYKPHDRSRTNSHGSELQGHGSHFSAAPGDVEAQHAARARTASHSSEHAHPNRPTLPRSLSKRLSMLSLTRKDKLGCDSNGPCRGFTETCQSECFKIVQARGFSNGHTAKSFTISRRPSLPPEMRHTETTPLLNDIPENNRFDTSFDSVPHSHGRPSSEPSQAGNKCSSNADSQACHDDAGSSMDDSDDFSKQHHHHVPNNAFLSIGLQTSIAIALHKLPEGFITYATNHANPELGVSVFLALFIHNITEGFALALPLYLAIQSRWRAMFWAFILGGCSQPLGAAIAALWFAVAGNTNYAPGERAYGTMFAVTSGIMASVALQLFGESLDLTHNRNLCMISAFVGMGVMGISSALTA